MKLLTTQNAKTPKGEKRGYLTGILYMTPADLASDGRNVCPNASPGCKSLCLNTAGRGIFSGVQAGRARKRHEFFTDRSAFLDQLDRDIASLLVLARTRSLTPVIRLNGTSDIAWEHMGIMEHYPFVQFYDYTKSVTRMARFLDSKLPQNYHLTFSRSELNNRKCAEILAGGGNVAVVFSTRKGEPLPQYAEAWDGHIYPVIDGDESDLRFTDPQGMVSLKHSGAIIGLRAKGKARHTTNGFVVQVR